MGSCCCCGFVLFVVVRCVYVGARCDAEATKKVGTHQETVTLISVLSQRWRPLFDHRLVGVLPSCTKHRPAKQVLFYIFGTVAWQMLRFCDSQIRPSRIGGMVGWVWHEGCMGGRSLGIQEAREPVESRGGTALGLTRRKGIGPGCRMGPSSLSSSAAMRRTVGCCLNNSRSTCEFPPKVGYFLSILG